MSRAPSRRGLAVAGAALLVVVGVIVVLVLRGGDEPTTPRPSAPRGIEPLAFMPPGADVVLDLDTGAPTVALAAAALVPRLPGATLDGDQLRPLLGGRMAIALDGGQMWLAAITRAPPPAVPGARKRGGTVVVGPSLPAPRPGARAEFDRRVTGLPGSSARVAFDARALLAARQPDFAATPWGRSLRGGAAVLELRGDRVLLPFQIAADPAAVTPSDLPVVPDRVPPVMRGRGPIVAAVRSPAQTLAFLRSAGLLPALDVLDRAPGFLRPNLSDLGPEATITTPDARVFTVRTTPPDPGDWSAKLGRLDALAELIRFTGIANVGIDRRPDGAYAIEQDGKLAGRVGVYGPVVVFSTDPRADLAAAARAAPTPTPPGAAGALTLRLAPALFGAVLPALARDHLGDVTGWARFAPPGVRGELGVAVR